MLKELRLKNLVLVESLAIPFSHDFNVLSGESGSGKSAIMNALRLIGGERSDPTCVRHGEEKGIVEAVFDCTALPHVTHLLEEAGIDHDPASELYIRREITAAGKSRSFINNQLAQLTLLKRLSAVLFEVVGQHANQKLLSLDYHRKTLDLFGNLEEELARFAHSWQEEAESRKTLEELTTSEAQRLRTIEISLMEIEELEHAYFKEGEEEEIFAEYTQLSNADELAHKAQEILQVLNGEKIGVLVHLARQKHTFDQLAKLAPRLLEAAASYENARLELQEAAHTLRLFEGGIEHNPQRAAHLESRLEQINRIKRKYGPTVEEVHAYHHKTKELLAKLQNADAAIELLQARLTTLSEKTKHEANALTAKRKAVAAELEQAVAKQLKSLNMPKVEFFAQISPQKRSRWGDDQVEFFLVPNVGEHRVPLRECASGGELSRVMLAIQTLLAGKENIPTLIFDEIDANIGGETASIVGEKLKEIAARHQVLCITHFPQVARQAEYHLRILKKEIDGRTVTLVDALDHASHLQELARMMGGITV